MKSSYTGCVPLCVFVDNVNVIHCTILYYIQEEELRSIRDKMSSVDGKNVSLDTNTNLESEQEGSTDGSILRNIDQLGT